MNAIRVVRHPRARRARLALDPATGEARLTLPPRAPLKPALNWAEGQREWLERQRARLPRPVPFAPDARIPIGGHEVLLVWDEGAARAPILRGDRLICGGPPDRFSARIARWLRTAARDLLTEETHEYADRLGVTVGPVSVGDPRARWGSCSASGAIRYSWRLILAPPWVRRSTVAHEVAHRVHMNHSPAFYALLATLAAGDEVRSRAWLRSHGAGLHWYGRDA